VKLPKGPLKVITFTTDAVLRENELRARAGGQIFHPTLYVAVEPQEGEQARVVAGFGVVLPPGAKVRSCITKFPHEWAGRRDALRYWIETTEAVDVITSSAGL
jgi:hypothetical protein